MLRKCFASFSIALLIFSVSVQVCFADPTNSVSDYQLSIFLYPDGRPMGFSDYPIPVPSAEEFGMWAEQVYGVDSSDYYDMYLLGNSNYYKPKPYDRTVYFSVGMIGSTPIQSTPFYFGSRTFDLYYTKEDTLADVGEFVLEDAGRQGGHIYQNITDYGDVATIRLTIPADSNSFRFSTEDALYWRFTQNGNYGCYSFGAYIIDTTDEAVLGEIEAILSQLESIDGNISNTVTAINEILAQLRLLNADTDTIIGLLNGLTNLSNSQLTQLQNISTSVDAIYYFLTQALKTEAEDASEALQDTAEQINNQSQVEEYWQTSMSGNYEALELDNFSFGGITGGVELVGNIFTDIWNVFGSYQILYTFPLVLGISLLAIGRLSKTGGGNSSRNSEHKGGEGGA